MPGGNSLTLYRKLQIMLSSSGSAKSETMEKAYPRAVPRQSGKGRMFSVTSRLVK